MIKADFRNFCKKHLMSLSKKSNFEDKKTVAMLKREILHLKSKNILLYCPMEIEVNIYPLIYWLKKQRGVRIFIPYIEGVSFKMIPFRLPLVKNKYSIFESKKSLFYLTKIDTAIVPCIGIDRDFKRIGFGKGMYDRFFANLRFRPNIIFVSRKVIYSKQKITDKYDIDADIVLSNGCKLKRGINDRILSDRFYNIWSDCRY
ncbi:5-formyltetrahydrofolate cyclo-ligase [Helicobacter cappadocius]|uniref:5-formyltetrahydrofolate cyclo-ligase n=1 Tax=Helicobacter cappadocius TaxID=3063998 RepID=A0AA90PU08_9HELI|nr:MULTISPECIES: 5-formyltetrahydrofolate cyclo-ligase [unclassified Helicobacter]MDO7253154.1 5-formyltetrahydrofolate cyclo-ligase [Helicobacter sp. faydin-H75]MDP2538720.1 5-formyltetrahydrofolate cyclo-ligase [Helicobacter sp. faydin-H76]